MYKIINNATLPRMKRAPKNQYPFEDMQVGDGIDIPNDMGTSPKGFSRRLLGVKNALWKYRKLTPENAEKKFVVGTCPDDPRYLRCVRSR